MSVNVVAGVEIRGAISPAVQEVLTEPALAFVADLHRRFNPTREQLLARRAERQQRLDQGEKPGFLAETAALRAAEWQV
ncbi:MAG TPA: hypothetical protein VNK95_05255, partial [Caldilineaceae bacterium]|nr:hypothetical protein [Caldilineaceae bacterium]